MMKRCSNCDQQQPPSVDLLQPCPYCGFVDGVEEDVLLEGEPAGVSIIRIWAKRLAITFVVVVAVGGLAITWILQETLENVIQAIVQ